MKKIVSILVAAAVALAFVGCDTVGVNGNSVDLTGTWTAVMKTVSNMSRTPAANTMEGTWEYVNNKYPTASTTNTSTSGGVTSNTVKLSDDTTMTQTIKTVVAADGSYTQTLKVVVTIAARAAIAVANYPANTTYVDSNGNGFGAGGVTAVQAQSYTWVQTKTVTVTLMGFEYKQNVKVVDDWTQVVAGTTSSQQKNSDTTTYLQDKSSLAYNGVANVNTNDPFGAGISVNANPLTQTVKGTTVIADGDVLKETTTTMTFVVAADGTYTLTTVTASTIPERPAVAATATTDALLAIAVGTTKETVVETGSLTTLSTVSQNGATPTNTVYFSPATKKSTKIGTGSGISTEYPAVELSKNLNCLPGTSNFNIIKGAGSGAKTNLVLNGTTFLKS